MTLFPSYEIILFSLIGSLPQHLERYVYEYVKDVNMPINQKIVEEAKTLAELHYKTSYFKNIKIDDIKKIYEDIKSNIILYRRLL